MKLPKVQSSHRYPLPWLHHTHSNIGGYRIKQGRIRTAARVRACNYVKFETGQNLPPVLKMVTRPAHAALKPLSIVAKHGHDQVFYF